MTGIAERLKQARIAALEEAIATVRGYDRLPFPGMEAGIDLIKKDIAYRIEKIIKREEQGL